jgi:hypothetical protein
VEYRRQQQEVLSMFKLYFLWLTPELRESVETEYLDMTNNILACKYMRISYIWQYESCLAILFRILRNQNALIFFGWDDFTEGVADKTQRMEKLYEIYGSHKFLETLGITPLIYNASLGDPESFSLEENTIEFFRLWAVHIEKQGFAVHQFDPNNPNLYMFALVPLHMNREWTSVVESIKGGRELFERFLSPPAEKAQAEILKSQGVKKRE